MGAALAAPILRWHVCHPSKLAEWSADLQKFYFKNQRLIWSNGTAGTVGSVGEVRRDEELDFSAFFDELNTLGPAGDHAIQREFNRLVPFVGAVKFLPVEQRAAIIDQDGVGGLRGFSGSRFEDLVLKSAGGLFDAGFGCVLCKEGLALFECGLCHGWCDESGHENSCCEKVSFHSRQDICRLARKARDFRFWDSVRLLLRQQVDRGIRMKTRERIYIVPRWAGLVYAAAVFVIFISGYFERGFGGLPQILVISLVVAGIVALIQTNENLRGVELESCQSQPVAAGGEAALDVTLRNSSDRARLGLKVRFRMGWRLVGDARIPVLGPGERVTVRIHFPCGRRGCHPNPPLWISSDHPVGLCFAWKVLEDHGQIFVYPQPVGQPLAASIPGGGEAGSRVRLGSDDVSGHQPYAAGDPPSRLDWRVFAKSGKLVVKTFERDGGDRLLLRWEDTLMLEDPEKRLEQLSLWVSECSRAMQPFELSLGQSASPLNETNIAACRMALAAFPA